MATCNARKRILDPRATIGYYFIFRYLLSLPQPRSENCSTSATPSKRKTFVHAFLKRDYLAQEVKIGQGEDAYRALLTMSKTGQTLEDRKSLVKLVCRVVVFALQQ